MFTEVTVRRKPGCDAICLCSLMRKTFGYTLKPCKDIVDSITGGNDFKFTVRVEIKDEFISGVEKCGYSVVK